jgi:hypothetical protein
VTRILAALVLLAPSTLVPSAAAPRPAHHQTRRVEVKAARTVLPPPPKGAKQRRTTVDLSPRSPAAPTRRPTRSRVRPPLAEETRWRSTSPKPNGRSSAPTSSHGIARSAGHLTRLATQSAAGVASESDLQRAKNLPEPWRSIVRCESLRDGSWRATSDSVARGWFQFLRSTWRSLGLSGDPAAASFDAQYAAARRLARRDGLRAWDCARLLGYA